MGIKKVVQAWNSVSLVKRIVIGLVIGGVLGVAVPNIEVVELLGTLFVSALKGVAPILVFFLVISALANARAAGSIPFSARSRANIPSATSGSLRPTFRCTSIWSKASTRTSCR